MNKEGKNMRLNKFGICLFLVSCFLFLGQQAFADVKAYDGIWFMGFNLNKPLLQTLEVRQAVAHCVNTKYIVTEIMSDEVVPASPIPPGMLGYNPEFLAYKYNPKYAKKLMKRAGYPINDPQLKTLSLLHTDGIKTVAIAEKIQSDLRKIGMKVNLVQINYQEEDKWVNSLVAGEHDFFLMGYKAGIEQLFTTEAAAEIDSYSLIEPLFKTGGDANFTGFSNETVDTLLDQLEGLNIALKEDRNKKLKEINKILYKDLPVLVLFYIEKL